MSIIFKNIYTLQVEKKKDDTTHFLSLISNQGGHTWPPHKIRKGRENKL